MSQVYYQSLILSKLKHMHYVMVKSGSCTNPQPVGLATCTFTLEQNAPSYEVILCTHLKRVIILGLDFLRAHRIGTNWSYSGKFIVNYKRQLLVESMKITIMGPRVLTKCNTTVPGRTMAVLNIKS